MTDFTLRVGEHNFSIIIIIIIIIIIVSHARHVVTMET